jgi:LacI family transcriptional regulator
VATIKDVAARSGFSIKTVSRVINNDPAVRGRTRERIKQTIAELDFVPDSIARSLRSRRTGTFGVITDFVVTTPHSVDLVRGIQDACTDAGLMALIVNTRECADMEQRALRMLLERKVDGLLYLTVRHRWLDQAPPVGELPTVLVNCSTRDGTLPAIVPDDFQGGYDATRYLIERGHRDLALISLIPEFEATRLRGDAFRQAMHDHGLTCRPDWILPGQIKQDGRDIYTTREATLAILNGPCRPSAIVCGKDEIAMRVYNTVRALGLRIPDDVSVIGYDDIVILAEGLDPPLTTVALPYYRMGREAVQMLGRLIEGTPTPEPLLKIPCPLVERQSCRDWLAGDNPSNRPAGSSPAHTHDSTDSTHPWEYPK